MVIQFFDKLSLFDQLLARINLDGFVPKTAKPEEMVQNIIDVYDAELEQNEVSYFRVKDSCVLDILEFIRIAGGYELFDFVV